MLNIYLSGIWGALTSLCVSDFFITDKVSEKQKTG